MIVDSVKNATTEASSVHYKVTLRVWPEDLESSDSDETLGNLVRKAINGIANYSIKKGK